MRISSLLKSKDYDVAFHVLQFMVESTPENTAATAQAFLQLIVDMMGVDFIVTPRMARDPCFHRLLTAVRYNLLRTDYDSKDYDDYRDFIIEVVRLAVEINFLELNQDWFTAPIKFLEALKNDENTQTLLSLLSIPFYISLINNLVDMKRLNLAEYWDSLLEIIKAGMRHPVLCKKVTEEMCVVTPRCNVANLSLLLPLYTEGLKIQHVVTNVQILKIIKNIFLDALLEEEKQMVADYFASSEPSLMLFELMFQKSINIVKETFEVVSCVHDYVRTIPSWSCARYNLIYFKMFHNNKNINSLAAKFFLKRLRKITSNEGEILIEILEFFFQYQPSLHKLSDYIDNLWEFEYMRSFKNIFTLLAEEARSNIIVCHFIISVTKKMQANFDLYKDDILYLLKRLPLLLKNLQKQKYPFAILLESFLIVDVNLYSAEFIGDLKYFNRATVILCDTFLRVNHGYEVQNNIFHILDTFVDLKFGDITLLVCETAAKTLQMFKSEFLKWERNEFQVEENSRKVIQHYVCNMVVIVVNARYFDKDTIKTVFKIMQKYYLERDYFQMFGCTKETSEAILLMCNIFKRIVLFYLQYPEEIQNYIPIAEVKENIKQFMLFLETIFQHGNQNKYYKKAAYEALISVTLITQPMFHYTNNENLKLMCIKITTERYLMILNFVERSTHSSNKEYGIQEQKEILSLCTELHQYHIGIPARKELCVIMIRYGYITYLENELFEFVKAILKSRSCTEEEGVLFTRVFGIIINMLVDREKKEATVEMILEKYLNLIEQHSSNQEMVGFISIVNVLAIVQQKVQKIAANGKINRLKVLKYLAPFTRLIIRDYCKAIIKNQLPKISTHFTPIELSTLKDFESTLLPTN